jgi:hypothetical protein
MIAPWPDCPEFVDTAPLVLRCLKQQRFPPVLVFQLAREMPEAFSLGVAGLFMCTQGTACGQCSECREIVAGKHPDILLVRSEDEGSIKLDDLREVEEFLQHPPQRRHVPYPRRVLIIGAVDTVTPAVANKLLKALEESPLTAQVILTSARIKYVPKTLLSRCVRWKVTSPEGPPMGADRHPVMASLVQAQTLTDVLKAAERIHESSKMPLEHFVEAVEYALNTMYRARIESAPANDQKGVVSSARRDLLRRLHRAARNHMVIPSQLAAEMVGISTLPAAVQDRQRNP